MATWTISYGGVTQSAEDWGIGHVRRTRNHAGAGMVSFVVEGLDLGAPAPFAWQQPMTIFKNGARWFQGWVTDLPRRGTTKDESLSYQISDAWYWLEKIPFQQQWRTLDPTGGGATTKTTTRSECILGQSLDGVKMDLGSVIREVLIYALYACQGVDFPDTVDVNHLPPAPPTVGTPNPPPFQIGTMTVNITGPYTQMRDKSCASIIKLLLKYAPDTIAWIDYTTPIQTLNIDKRANLANKQISVLPGGLVQSFSAKPRNDLQVPCVIVKFEQHNTQDGETYDDLTVQQYPENVKSNTPGAWVQTIDLVGSQSTRQTAKITTVSRPVDWDSVGAIDWIYRKEAWLKQQQGSTYVWDWGNVQLSVLNTTLDPNDPLLQPDGNPANIPPDCKTLTSELIAGTVSDWMTTNSGIVAAKVKVEAWLVYQGADDATAALFTFDPLNPSTPTAPGAGYLIRFYELKVTNGSTGTYSELTSLSGAEPVPAGYAQSLYTALSKLHFSGDLVIVEDECSDLLPIGSIFNTTDGQDEWKTMDALVLSVTEDLETGTTAVQYGPPVVLGLDTLEELYRANLGRLPAWKLDQRTTGKITAGATVQSDTHAADTNTNSAPKLVMDPPFPFQVLARINPTTKAKELKVSSLSTLFESPASGATIAIGNLDTWTAVTGTGKVYLQGTIVSYAPTTVQVLFDNGFDPDLPPWTAGGKLENDGATPPNQTFFRYPIANYDATGSGISIDQKTSTNLAVIQYIESAYPAIYPIPN